MNSPIQQKAIETLDRNVALVAGAGTGKTRVLTERFLHILKHGGLSSGEETRGVVAITFTRKAAGEMKARILERLQTESAENPEWEPLLSQLTQLRISTIHSFCEQLLRARPLSVGLDPNFHVIEEGETDLWLRAAFFEAYDRWILDPVHFDLAATYDWMPLESFPEDLIRLYHAIRAGGVNTEEVRERTLRFPAPDENAVRRLLADLSEALDKGKATPAVREKVLSLPETERLLQGEDVSGWAEFLETLHREKLLGTGKGTAGVRQQIPHCLYTAESDNEPAYRALLGLLEELDAVYRAYKQERSALDFDDLQEQVLILLEDPVICAEIQKEIRYLLIDECQDINGMQQRIFEKICSRSAPLDRDCLFIVGDPRQSIYGFRYADVALFESMIEQIAESGGVVLEMSDNFRSSRSVIDFVNRVSEDHFPGRSPLCAAKEYPEAEVVHVDNTDASLALENTILTLRHLHENEGIQWENMALLFRSGTRMGETEQRLRDARIPVFSYAAAGVWETQEAMDLEHTLRAMLSDRDIGAWLAFLRSPLAGVTDDELFRWSKEVGDWPEKIKRRAWAEEGKAVALHERVVRWKKHVSVAPVGEALDAWMKETAYRVYAAGLPGGERRLAAIDTVLQWVTERERQHPEPPAMLAEAWESKRLQAEKTSPDMGAGGAVELFTIHKAKGLEKDVVLFMDVDAQQGGRTPAFLWDEQKGIAIRARRTGRHLLASEAIKEKEKVEDTRILYVALTRAKTRLLLGLRSGTKRSYRKILAESGNDPAELPAALSMVAMLPTERAWDRETPRLLPGQIPRPQQQAAVLHVTQFLMYRQCPRAWALRYRYGLRPEWVVGAGEPERAQWESDVRAEGLTGTQRGILLHELIERDPGDRPEEEFVLERAAALGMTPSADEIGRQSDWLRAWRKEQPPGTLWKEVPFTWKRNGWLWKGAIDLVAEHDGEVTLLDFKTNLHSSEEEMLRHYTAQLQFYAAAWEAIAGIRPTTAAIWWFPKGKRLRVDISPVAVQETLDAMDAFAADQAKTGAWDTKDCTDDCGWQELCSLL